MFNDLPLIVPQQPIDTRPKSPARPLPVLAANDRRLLARLTDETVLKGVNMLPLFAGLAGLAVRLLAMSATWWREGR